MYDRKISEICNNSINRNEKNNQFILEIIKILETDDFPNKYIKCNEPEEAFRLLKDMLENEKSEVQVDFDVIYCTNENLIN